MRRSGITSRSKCAIFSISQISCSSAEPSGPAVLLLVLSATGAPVALVNRFVVLMFASFLVESVRALASLSRVWPAPDRLRGWAYPRGVGSFSLCVLVDRAALPCGLTDHAAEIPAVEMRVLVGQHVGLPVAPREGGNAGPCRRARRPSRCRRSSPAWL